MGYGWARRLRPIETSFIPRFARHFDLLRDRFARFAGQRTREGSSIISSTVLGSARHMLENEMADFISSGSRKSFTSARTFPSSSLAASLISAMIRRQLRSCTRPPRSQLRLSRYVIPQSLGHDKCFSDERTLTPDSPHGRQKMSVRRLARSNTSSVLQRQTMVFARCLSTLHERHYFPRRRRRRSAKSCECQVSQMNDYIMAWCYGETVTRG